MATYKVLQDIEAEDKFLGPLTLKQFILAAVALVCCYLSVVFIAKGIWVLAFPLVPVIIVSGFLAFPWGRDQPTEIWLLAKIRFAFKPRVRIWDQSGMQELVKITVPKKIEEQLSDGLSQTEVKSRLRALADTIDSRGWAVKGVDMSTAAQMVADSSDRLVAASTLPKVGGDDLAAGGGIVDIFDDAKAQRLDTQIVNSSQAHRQELVQTMRNTISDNGQTQPVNNFWFMNQQDNNTPAGFSNFGAQNAIQNNPDESPLPASMRKPADTDPDEAQILNTLNSNKSRSRQAFSNHRTIDPYSINRPQNALPQVTERVDPATIELARNNDRTIESLARETNRIHDQQDDGEVIISLH